MVLSPFAPLTDDDADARTLLATIAGQITVGRPPQLEDTRFTETLVAATFASAFDESGRPRFEWFAGFQGLVNNLQLRAGLQGSGLATYRIVAFELSKVPQERRWHSCWYGHLLDGATPHRGVLIRPTPVYIELVDPFD